MLAFTASWLMALLLWHKHTPSFALDWLEALFVSFMSSAVVTGIIGTLLAAFGIFALLLLAGCLLLLSAVLLLWQRPLVRAPAFSPLQRSELFLLLPLLFAGFVYFQPHQYILGGTDAGTYVNVAATLARTGDYVFEDEWNAVLREHAATTLRAQPAQWETDYLQFVGWYLDNQDPARVIPQFFSFHPVWLAIAIELAGLTGAYLMSPLWMVLGLVALYLFARFLFDPRTGLLATLILALNALTIFFGRYPTTEPLTLLLLFAGFLSFQRLWQQPSSSRLWGAFGGLMFGAALLTRIDLPLLPFFLLLAAVWQWRWRGWSGAWTLFAVTFGLVAAYAGILAAVLHWPYAWNTYSIVIQLLREELLLFFLLGLFLLLFGGALYLYGRQRNVNFDRLWTHLGENKWLRWSAAVSLVLLSAYAYFLRPLQASQLSYPSWPGGTEIPILNHENWVRLGWYLTPLGLLLATAGAAYLLIHESWKRLWFFLAVSLLTTIQYVYNIFNTPYQIYGMRRYLPLILPSLSLFAAVLLVRALWQTGRRPLQVLGAIGALLLLGGLIYQARYVLPQQDFDGAPAQLLDLEAELKPGSILIMPEESSDNFGDRFGAPLYFLFDHPVATVRTDEPALIDSFVQDVQEYAAAEQRPLQLLAVDSIPEALEDALPLDPNTMVPFRTQMLANTFEEFPSRIQNIYYGIEIYDISPTAAASEPGSTTVDIGTLDTLYIADGFHYKEPRAGDITMRWTGEDATLHIPLTSATPVTVSIRAMIFRPETVPATPVTVLLDNRPLGQFTPQGDWQTYTFSGTADPVDGLSTLHFRSTTFNPRALALSGDGRDLGFLLDWVEIQPDKTGQP